MGKFKPGDNPFTPDVAAEPGHLADRDRELGVISCTLERLNGPRDAHNGRLKKTPLTAIRLVGPRGSGKTALLKAAKLQAEKNNISVALISRLANLSSKSELCVRLAEIMRGEGLWAQAMAHADRLTEMKAGPAGAGFVTDEQRERLKSIVQGCLAKRPLLLLLDDAMEAEPAALQELLAICQEMFSYQYPLAFMLAGTPRLDHTLAKTRAGFADRTENLYISTLTPEATREGLRVPFEEKRAEVNEKALELMAGMADDYPQFIQIVGHEVWKAWASAGRDEVDRELVSQAQASIQRKRESFYQGICRRIRTDGLIGYARHVMELLHRNGGRVSSGTIIRSIAAGFEEDGHSKGVDICYELMDLGFIWATEDHRMEAGIPGLLDYCERNERKGAPAPAE